MTNTNTNNKTTKSMATQTQLKNVRKGQFFAIALNEQEITYGTDVRERNVWIRSDYDRTSKRFMAFKFGDICHETGFKGDKLVWIDFNF